MPLDKAIQVIEQAREAEIERHKREMAELDDALLRLRQQEATSGDSEQEAHPTVRRNQYRGMKANQALLMYLNERGGGPVRRKQAAMDLRLAGAEPDWSAERYERNIAIMLRNNEKLFHYDENADMIEVAEKAKGRKLA